MLERDRAAIAKPGWIPYDLVFEDERPLLEWRYIGTARLRDSWFEFTVRRNGPAVNGGVRPLRTPLEVLDDGPPQADLLPLCGIIHHASRVGSTLMTQMYACSPRLSVLAEPPIIESLIDWTHGQDETARGRLVPRLRAALGYLGRRRLADEERLVLKTESEHVLDLPLFEEAFPGVPWIYLFRPPEAILFSHGRQRGRQMVPYMVRPERLGLSRETLDPALLDEYCAWMLERTFEAVLEPLEAGRGRAVHYRRLPEYGWREAAERFALELTDEEIEAMRARSRLDAKSGARQQPYAGGASCGATIPEALRALTGGRLQALYRRLEALDGAADPPSTLV